MNTGLIVCNLSGNQSISSGAFTKVALDVVHLNTAPDIFSLIAGGDILMKNYSGPVRICAGLQAYCTDATQFIAHYSVNGVRSDIMFQTPNATGMAASGTILCTLPAGSVVSMTARVIGTTPLVQGLAHPGPSSWLSMEIV